jgi:hypothetical protein
VVAVGAAEIESPYLVLIFETHESCAILNKN